MQFIKKSSLFLFIILLIVSVYKDLFTGSSLPSHSNDTKIQDNIPHEVLKVKVKKGETVLSIVEKINQMEHNDLNIQSIMDDFQVANPNTDPYQLKPGMFYYFPLYKEE